jgi:hypothetical protein
MPKQQTKAPRPRFFDKIQLAWSTARYVDGIWVGSWRTPSDLRRVEDALLLIKQYSPLQYSRVMRDLSRIWVFVLTDGGAQYDHSLKACMLDERDVANSTVERIASTIIHEATHARLERLGVEYKEALRSRIEIICFRRQLAFVVKLANSAELQEELVRSIEWYGANNDWFSDTNFRDRDTQGSVRMLDYMEAPEWFIRIAPKVRSVISGVRRFYTSLFA